MLSIIKKLFIGDAGKKTMAQIRPPYWSATYPEYYKMLRHEFASDGIRFQQDVINPISATFDFINEMAIDVAQKEILKELCIANAAFSARAANGGYFSRTRKEEERWGHDEWLQREHEWQYAVFHTALLINLFKYSTSDNEIDLRHFSIDIDDDEIALSITSAIHDREHKTMPSKFYPLIKKMNKKTSDFLIAGMNESLPST